MKLAGINRIRLEFKVITGDCFKSVMEVLIESGPMSRFSTS